MIARLPTLRKAAAQVAALAGFVALAACEPVNLSAPGGNAGPEIDTSGPVRVALLVPGGSAQQGDNAIAEDLENAARLAIEDLSGRADIDLAVYNTAADPDRAAAVADQAAAEGAKVILGPLLYENAARASVAVKDDGLNVLAFTNNTDVAGGNLFILGSTFENTANRLVRFGNSQGMDRYLVVYGDNAGGRAGRDAVASAVRGNGGTLLGAQTYSMTQQAITAAAPQIASVARQNDADAVFTTAAVNSDLPILASTVPEAGLDTSETPFMGLTRWDAAPQALSLTGLQGGYFAKPAQGPTQNFERRYSSAYGEQPHPLAGLAYDGIAAIGALIAEGDRNALSARSLTQSSGFRGTGGAFRLLPDGTNERALDVATVRNNQVVIVDPAPSSFGGF